MIHNIEQLNKEIEGFSAEQVLEKFINEYSGKIALASSLSIEDQTLTDMIRRLDPRGEKCRIFTLDTGRLFPEAYSLIEKTNMQYRVPMEVMFPNSDKVQQMVGEKGVNLFYHSIENRRECCGVRKIEPLRRAFEGLEVWICGLRSAQSITRADMRIVEFDKGNNLLKLNPLMDWSEQQTWDYIDQNTVPFNPLQRKGFLSIGCQPCTRAVEPGQDIRAGRWWWEDPEQKECGLHK